MLGNGSADFLTQVQCVVMPSPSFISIPQIAASHLFDGSQRANLASSRLTDSQPVNLSLNRLSIIRSSSDGVTKPFCKLQADLSKLCEDILACQNQENLRVLLPNSFDQPKSRLEIFNLKIQDFYRQANAIQRIALKQLFKQLIQFAELKIVEVDKVTMPQPIELRESSFEDVDQACQYAREMFEEDMGQRLEAFRAFTGRRSNPPTPPAASAIGTPVLAAQNDRRGSEDLSMNDLFI